MGGFKDVQNVYPLASEVFPFTKKQCLTLFWIVHVGLFPLMYFSPAETA